MTDITFHSMRDSAYLWTAMQIADEKGITHDFVELTYRSAAHLRLHPFGKMPVMQHRDLFLYETLAIAHYIDKAFEGPALQYADATRQANLLRWISIVNSYVFPVMNRFMKERLVRPAWGSEVDTAFIESAREPLTIQTRLIEEALSRTRFLAGDSLTIADCFLLPHLLFFGLTKEGENLLAEAVATARWLKEMCDRPSYRRSPMVVTFETMRQLPRPEHLWA